MTITFRRNRSEPNRPDDRQAAAAPVGDGSADDPARSGRTDQPVRTGQDRPAALPTTADSVTIDAVAVRPGLLRPGPVRWLVLVLVVGLLGFAAAVAVFLVRSSGSADAGGTTLDATVTNPAPCSAADARDGIEYQLNGKTQQAKLDGCGHIKGAQLSVLLPAGTAAGAPVREAGTKPAAGEAFVGRLTPFLVVLAALAGAGYVFVLTGARLPKTARRDPAA